MRTGAGIEQPGRWLFRYAVLTAAVTLVLLAVGGLVTSRGAGMAVPDWPTSYGYNMFFFPFSHWMGGIFYEHSHRLIASLLGLLVVGLTRWLGGRPARLPLAVIGTAEVLAGLVIVPLFPAWKATGHFLSGIGGVVLLAALVWAKNRPAPGKLPLLGWLAFFGVQAQGFLGGLRVVLFRDEIGIFHAALAQLFFILICAIALLCSGWWARGTQALRITPGPRRAALGLCGLVFLQLLLGATMRHQHAGLAIPDFPLAYGRVWPATDPDALARYNAQRVEVTAQNPITAPQIHLQMAHRVLALVILGAVAAGFWRARRELGAAHVLARLWLGWVGLIGAQAALGAWTVWSNKAADIATAHMVLGAVSLAFGAMVSIVSLQASINASERSFSAGARDAN